MKTIKCCPKCKKELIKEINSKNHPYVCTECDKNFYEFEAIQQITDYTEADIEFIKGLDLRITPFGIVLTPEDYFKYINGGELNIGDPINSGEILNDYILIKHTGEFEFVHYSQNGLTNIKPSIDPEGELSFGGGIYCYASTHIPVELQPTTTLYKGIYNGDYLECMYDSDTSETCDKGYGNTKEYLLLTSEMIPVETYKTSK